MKQGCLAVWDASKWSRPDPRIADHGDDYLAKVQSVSACDNRMPQVVGIATPLRRNGQTKGVVRLKSIYPASLLKGDLRSKSRHEDTAAVLISGWLLIPLEYRLHSQPGSYVEQIIGFDKVLCGESLSRE
jgi:hypothetical protein